MLEKLPLDIQTSVLAHLGKTDKSGLWQRRSVNKYFKKLSEVILLKDETNAVLNVLINKYLEDCKNESNQKAQTAFDQQKERIEKLASKIVTFNLMQVNKLDVELSNQKVEEDEEKIWNEIKEKLTYVEKTFDIVYKANKQLSKNKKICPCLENLSYRMMESENAWEFKFDNWIIKQCKFNAVLENCNWENASLEKVSFGAASTYRYNKLALARSVQEVQLLGDLGYEEEGIGLLSEGTQSFIYAECRKIADHFKDQILTAEKENQQLREEVQRLRAKLEELAEKDEVAKVENDKKAIQKRMLEHSKSDGEDENNYQHMDKKTCSSLSNK